MASAVEIGVFIVPDAAGGAATVEQIIEAERCGLDIVGVQDHPYQWRFFDTWTLLAYVAGRTERVRLVPDVLNLPLRLRTEGFELHSASKEARMSSLTNVPRNYS